MVPGHCGTVLAFSELGFAHFELNVCLDFDTVQQSAFLYEYVSVDSSYQHNGFILQVWSKYSDNSAGFISLYTDLPCSFSICSKNKSYLKRSLCA
jgi:hypothetical protein